MMTIIILVVVLFTACFANAVPHQSAFPHRHHFAFSADLERKACFQQPGLAVTKVGKIIEGHNLTWGESIGWINLRTTHADLKIGSNILAGWIWFENCGWVCLGEGRPLDKSHYSNRVTYDWGVNNDGQGNLSGYAWSEVTGWISFRTSHSRVYLDESGQFYGYAWGENVGWMHFGTGRTVQYLAKADPGPWRDIEPESAGRLAGDPDDSEMSNGSVPVTGMRNNHERYDEYAWTIYLIRIRKDDSCARIRCCDTPVYISSLATLAPIRAPPCCG
ncbi:MAG: hypothetical protein NTZ78_04840 [Candidatus Aureabacteria bacterium]|nr:hypothetical protein [Candidatus Auribacterota bacterium]